MVANRNGRGGVTLGVTTEFGQYKFEVVLENSADLGWYKKLEKNKVSKLDVLRLCLRPHDAKCSKDVILSKLGSTIQASPIEALNMAQGKQCWFELRKFSLSSRTISSTWKALANLSPDDLLFKRLFQIVKQFVSKEGPQTWEEAIMNDLDLFSNNGNE